MLLLVSCLLVLGIAPTHEVFVMPCEERARVATGRVVCRTMVGHDIFALSAAGFAQGVDAYLEALPLAVRGALLDGIEEGQWRSHVKTLEEPETARLHGLAELILHGGSLDREQLEPILHKNGVAFGSKDSPHALVYELVEKVGAQKARALLEDELKPGQISSQGTFADHKAPDLDLSELNALKIIPRLEKELEDRFSQGSKERRLVKARMEYVAKTRRLVIGFYFQQPATDGTDIEQHTAKRAATEKRLVTKVFPRPAASTFVTMRRSHNRVLVTFRSHASPTSRKIRQALSVAIWEQPGSIAEQPMSSFDLQIFAKPSFRPRVHDDYDQVGEILFSRINVEVASGNRVTVQALGSRANALEDYRDLAKAAPPLKGALVEEVGLKFMTNEEKPKVLARATVQPKQLKLDEQYRAMIEEHLDLWGVRET